MKTKPLKIDRDIKALIPPLAPEELAQLEANLKADGCRDPLVVWKEEGVLLDGHNRKAICEKQGITFEVTELSFPDKNAARVWVIQNQFGRRNLSPFARSELALELEGIFAAQGLENKREGGREKGRGKLLQNSAKAIDTRSEVAKLAGVSHDTVAKAKVIREKASEDDKQALREGKKTINQVHKKIRTEEKVEAVRKLAAEAKAKAPSDGLVTDLRAVAGRYGAIYADPPWSYGDDGCDGGVKAQYETMSLEAIAALPVGDLALKAGAHLWMWTTWPMIRDGAPHKVLQAWGFRWVGEMVWVKPGLGVGRWLRPATEVLVLGVRGTLPLARNNVRALMEEPRGRHSEKPEAFAQLVEGCSPGPFIELFARTARKGWDRWGNQA